MCGLGAAIFVMQACTSSSAASQCSTDGDCLALGFTSYACGVDGVCVVRALGESPLVTVPALQRALCEGRGLAPVAPRDDFPGPSLAND